jgi:hypothetical protein
MQVSEGSSLFLLNPFILSHFQYQSAARKHRLELRVASTGQKEVIGHLVPSGVLVRQIELRALSIVRT